MIAIVVIMMGEFYGALWLRPLSQDLSLARVRPIIHIPVGLVGMTNSERRWNIHSFDSEFHSFLASHYCCD